MERRLAAILATDVVGYSRLMGADETGTLAALKAQRTELIDPKVAQYNGRIIKLMGDGALMEFPSVVDAVIFATEMQLEMQQRNASLAEDRQIHYRIGINIGDVIVEDDDIFGDGVNIAARLEGLAEPGGICIGRNVRNQIRDKVDLNLEELGEVEVKNIARPIRAFRVLLDEKASALSTPVVAVPSLRPRKMKPKVLMILGMLMALLGTVAWWHFANPSRTDNANGVVQHSPTEATSIAVLAFKNLSGEADQAYLSDAIAEDITTELSRFGNLFVISRESAFSYRDQTKTARQIGQELGVRYLLEGSVQLSGSHMRVTVQLIDTREQNHVWAEKYDREVTDILVVQDDIVRSVVTALGEKIWHEAAESLQSKPLESFEAYDFSLRGSEALHKLTKDSNQEARRLYKKALELDPGLPDAHLGLAWTYYLDYDAQWSDTGTEALDQAYRYAQIANDEGAPGYEIHRLFGQISAARGDHEKALQHIARAIELNPNDGDLLATRAMLLRDDGQLEEAHKWIEDAIRRNPHHPDWYGSVLSAIHYMEKDYEGAVSILNRAKSLAIWDHLILAASHARLGEVKKAQQHASEVLTINPGFSIARITPRIEYRRHEDRQHYLEGLRKAGLPE
ncbi:tetratricopeptide repeat protein [Stappia sp. GBMRC 2046]|uniref:Tetratricopeptide repeat protein n=1 Tax=Stappia sediminis TaxID=2692190 RepID=A0A7X3LTP7_9HYPH|nr:tetratricopeptide repeat protein [Stappia sediminis]MXN64932.1 tetratricopeptide repeat protein [Stappia sediminis]